MYGVPRPVTEGATGLPTRGPGRLGSACRRRKLGPYLTPRAETNSKWIKILNAKMNSKWTEILNARAKILQGKHKFLCPGMRQQFLAYNAKSTNPKTKQVNRPSSKLNTFVLPKTPSRKADTEWEKVLQITDLVRTLSVSQYGHCFVVSSP